MEFSFATKTSELPCRLVCTAFRSGMFDDAVEPAITIRVNAVSPGTIDTDYHRTFSTEQMLNGVRAATPMGRLGTSGEVADVIVFLCSEDARFVQGQAIEVNGGFLMV